jgi:hypothetical protein
MRLNDESRLRFDSGRLPTAQKLLKKPLSLGILQTDSTLLIHGGTIAEATQQDGQVGAYDASRLPTGCWPAMHF